MSGLSGFQAATVTEMLKNENAPKLKKHFVYDVSGNVTDIYYAQAELASGVCLRQRFAYTIAGGSDVVEDETWETGNWDSAWNI